MTENLNSSSSTRELAGVGEYFRRNGWLLCLFVGFCLLYLSVQNAGYFDASDSFFRFKMMKSLVTTGSPNWTNPETGEIQTCLNTVGPAIAALPFQGIGYLAYRLHIFTDGLDQVLTRATVLGNVFYTALWMCSLAWLCILLGSSKRWAFYISVLAGTATMIFPYAKSAQGENLVGLCITLIVILLYKYQTLPRLRYLSVTGLLYGFLLTCKPELIAVFPLLFLAVVYVASKSGWRLKNVILNYKPWLIFGMAIVPGILMILVYNYMRYGGILRAGVIDKVSTTSLLHGFSHPFFSGLYLQLFSPGKGLFWYCPLLFATVPFCFKFLKSHQRIMVLPYCWWLVMTCVYAVWNMPTGDAALGSRFQVSYLGFAVLPLLALPLISGLKLKLAKAWLALCAVLSFGLQVLFCAVSFNIDYDRKFYSVDGFVNRYLHLQVTYYTFAESLLTGFFSTAREGLLDLYFVRLNTLESALTILPAFWWILAGSACAFGTAYYYTGENKSHSRLWSARMILVQMPAICLAVLGVMKIGDPGESGLRLRISNSKNATYKTVVQDISIHKLLNGREVYTLASPFQMRWSGDIYCPRPGTYSFQTDSNKPLKFSMAKQEKRTEPGISTVNIVVLDGGWQSLKIYCYETETPDHFFVKCKFPGQPHYKAIGDYKLKH